MTGPSKEDLKALKTKIADLRGDIESMEKMAKRGLDMTKPLEQAQMSRVFCEAARTSSIVLTPAAPTASGLFRSTVTTLLVFEFQFHPYLPTLCSEPLCSGSLALGPQREWGIPRNQTGICKKRAAGDINHDAAANHAELMAQLDKLQTELNTAVEAGVLYKYDATDMKHQITIGSLM